MCLALNFYSQMTCLSGRARARKSPLPDGVTSLAREHHEGVGDLALRCLLTSLTGEHRGGVGDLALRSL
jgi:hypothetical protein